MLCELSQIRRTVDTKTKGENLFSYELSNNIIDFF